MFTPPEHPFMTQLLGDVCETKSLGNFRSRDFFSCFKQFPVNYNQTTTNEVTAAVFRRGATLRSNKSLKTLVCSGNVFQEAETLK